MMTEQEITSKLEQAGYKSADIRLALRDVMQVIIAKTSEAYLEMLPGEQRDLLRSFTEEELQEYLAEHQGDMPRMSQEMFEKIHDETWEDYFRSVA